MVKETDRTNIKQEELIQRVRNCDLNEERLALREYRKIQNRKELWVKLKPVIKRIIVDTKRIMGK